MKKISPMTKTMAIVMSIAILFGSCASSTMIESIPKGATVYINGSKSGKTPFLYSDTKIIGSSTMIRLEKEGYEPFDAVLSRNEAIDVGAIIGGLFVGVPFLWAMKYDPIHTYELMPINNNQQNYQTPTKVETSARVAGVKTTEQKLSELKTLYEKKLITKEEYEAQKKRILNEN